MLDAELGLKVVAVPTLAHSVVGGVALMQLDLQLSADDVAVSAFLQVVPVLRVVQIWTRCAHCGFVSGAVLCHKGSRRALMAHHFVVSHGVSPWVGGSGAGDRHSQEKHNSTNHPLG